MSIRNTVVLNLNGKNDSQPVRGYQVLSDNPANRVKAVASCVFNTMHSMDAGKDHEQSILASGATIRSR